jgi:hypothetical protein
MSVIVVYVGTVVRHAVSLSFILGISDLSDWKC